MSMLIMEDDFDLNAALEYKGKDMIYFETTFDEETQIRTTKVKISPGLFKVITWVVVISSLSLALAGLGWLAA